MTETDDKTASVTRRRALALGAGGAAATALAAPAVAQSGQATIEWKMVTSWPKDLPGPGITAQRIADNIALMSGGRLRIRLFAAGELVPALEVFDAVSSGTAQMGHSASFFWQGKLPAAVFFTAVPFGLLPLEHITWIEQGGGQELWDELYGPFGVNALMAGNTGVQMGGWFKNEIMSLEDLKGLKIRMPGLGGEVMRRLGATPVSLPPAELFGALQSGLIDATEFLGPWSDTAMGFHEVAKLYYAPGFHEPNGTGEALFNSVAFEGLPDDLKAIVRDVCRAENARSLAESEWMNSGYLRALQNKHGVEVKIFPDDVLQALRTTSEDVTRSVAEIDEISERIVKSFLRARNRLSQWSSLSTRLYLDSRDG
ncbi:ABC transporter substrate-binding protein [Stappia sp. GBMRC 2046]|uniref:ABC transporter substrate-binding protein n=1 Tax=Stappia sediminis TaxID=2692190 RepID=A0A7X3LRC9_9HYPH|nr:TRAP transporter substrate-binding protein [Stappia sediminis]MXN63665.1 ABC transporter substrate-binding protein [Stappia sediminis]